MARTVGLGLRVAVTGGSGFLGAHLLARLRPRVELLALARRDLSDGAMRAVGPDVVIHLAAATDPAWCEAHPDRARAANEDLSRRLAHEASKTVNTFVYASTDLVFDGERGNYAETDTPRPISVYGSSKLSGEQAVREVLGERALIVRLSLMYGPRAVSTARESFAETMLARARSGEPVSLFADEYRSPLYVEDAAEHLARLVERPIEPRVVHLGGPEKRSRHEMGVIGLEVFGIPTHFARAGLRGDNAATASRPADVSFDVRRAQSLGMRPRGLREGFEKFRDRMKKT